MSLRHLERRIKRHAAKMERYYAASAIIPDRDIATSRVYRNVRVENEDDALLSLSSILTVAVHEKRDAAEPLAQNFARYMTEAVAGALATLFRPGVKK